MPTIARAVPHARHCGAVSRFTVSMKPCIQDKAGNDEYWEALTKQHGRDQIACLPLTCTFLYLDLIQQKCPVM